MNAAELTEECYGKPITDVPTPSAEVIAGAYVLHHDGYGPGDEYGVIVRRTDPYGGPGEAYGIHRCSTAEYRDNVLCPFHGFYDSTLRMERFGPDLAVADKGTGPRSVVVDHAPIREGNGSSRTWSRTLRGVPHSFTAVLMPNGERRYAVSRYNGYGDDGTTAGRRSGMRFGCAWTPVAFWTVKA